MNLKKGIVILLIVFLIILLELTNCVSAVSGFAVAVGTTYKGINTEEGMEYAADCYDRYGYSNTRRLMDPSYMLRLSNVVSTKVQFYDEHGNVNVTSGGNSGIIVGDNFTSDTGIEYIGTNFIGDWNDTVLVTYLSCLTAGNGSPSSSSITYDTVSRGAKIAVGFLEEIYPASSTSWSKRYNDQLADGKGVYDAASYANNFIYLYPEVKNWNLVYSISENLNLGGNYANLRNLDSNNLIPSNYYKTSYSKEKIGEILQSIDKGFKMDNYDIVRRNGASKTNINTGETTNKEYIDVVLKIGDFLTEAGYVVELENNEIVGIYDSNIDLEKQKEALSHEEDFFIDDSKLIIPKDIVGTGKSEIISLDDVKRVASERIKDKYSEDDGFSIKNISSKYFYDISSNKKYIATDFVCEFKDGDVICYSGENVFTEVQ